MAEGKHEKFAVIPGMTMIRAGKVYSGSYSGMQYKFRLVEEGLEACVWPWPWCLDKADPETVVTARFELTGDGLRQAEDWVCEQYWQDRRRWDKIREAPMW